MNAKLAYKIYDYIFSPEQQEEERNLLMAAKKRAKAKVRVKGKAEGTVLEALILAPKVYEPSSVATSMTKNGNTVFVKLPDYSREEIDNSDYHEAFTIAISEHKEILLSVLRVVLKQQIFFGLRWIFRSCVLLKMQEVLCALLSVRLHFPVVV